MYEAGVRDGSVIRGRRVFLVDGVWPRGVRRAELGLDGWVRGAAPSASLRRWFGHEVGRWAEFRERYRAELDRFDGEGGDASWGALVEAVGREPVTLLYAARDSEHNNAVVLCEYLRERCARR